MSTAEAAEPLAVTLTVNTESSRRGVRCATSLSGLGPYQIGRCKVSLLEAFGKV